MYQWIIILSSNHLMTFIYRQFSAASLNLLIITATQIYCIMRAHYILKGVFNKLMKQSNEKGDDRGCTGFAACCRGEITKSLVEIKLIKVYICCFLFIFIWGCFLCFGALFLQDISMLFTSMLQKGMRENPDICFVFVYILFNRYNVGNMCVYICVHRGTNLRIPEYCPDHFR